MRALPISSLASSAKPTAVEWLPRSYNATASRSKIPHCSNEYHAPSRRSCSEIILVEPPRAPDLAPQRERPPELNPDLRPRLGAPLRVQHHSQDAVDAEPRRASFISSTSVVDPLLRHLDRVGISILLSVEHDAGLR